MKPPLRHSFTTMGTVVTLIVPARPASGASEAPQRRSSSSSGGSSSVLAVSTGQRAVGVNTAAGEWVQVSRPFAILTERSLRYRGGDRRVFDPTVLPALAAAGYDRDWADVEARGVAEDEELAAIRRDFAALMSSTAPRAARGARSISTVREPAHPRGSRDRLGGIAKGWTVDRAVGRLQNLPWAIVNAGGDLRVVGTPPRAGLDIGIEDPTTPASRRSGWGSSRAHSRPRRSRFARGVRVTIT